MRDGSRTQFRHRAHSPSLFARLQLKVPLARPRSGVIYHLGHYDGVIHRRRHHLSAAKGWLEKICPSHRDVPEVLDARWQIYTLAGRHDAALGVAVGLVKGAPDRYAGYICRSHSLNELGRTQEAVDSLVLAAKKFPTLGVIPFHIRLRRSAMGR